MAYDLLVTAPASLDHAAARDHAEALSKLAAVRSHELSVHDPESDDPAGEGDPLLLSIKLLDADLLGLEP